jgi:ABC-type phosphate transport system substrate-binding protein
MSKFKLLTGASALLMAGLAFGTGASAQTSLYGSGSSLWAPNGRGEMDCLGQVVAAGFDKQGVSSIGNDPTVNGTLGTGIAAIPGCPHGPDTYNYMSSGSGQGIAAFFANDGTTYAGKTSTSSALAGAPYPKISFGASDAGLGASDVNNYLCSAGPCVEGGAPAPGGYDFRVHVAQHLSGLGAAGAGVGNLYLNPYDTYGPMIQFPVLVTPVALGYNPVTKIVIAVNKTTGVITKITKTTVKLGVAANGDGSGGVHLDMPTFCAIANGKVVSWGDNSVTLLNGGSSTTPGTKFSTAAIELVGRSDSSGTTSIFYRALAAQCTGSLTYTYNNLPPKTLTYTNKFLPAGSKTLPTTAIGLTTTDGVTTTGTPPAGKFTIASGSGNVAKYTENTWTGQFNSTTGLPLAGSGIPLAAYTVAVGQPIPSGWGWVPGKTSVTFSVKKLRVGYLGPDFTLPAVTNTGTNTYGLNIVDFLVAGTPLEPTGAEASAAFTAAGIVPPQSDSAGNYVAANTSAGVRSAPQDWAEPISTTQTLSTGVVIPTALANPTLNHKYPFVGTTDGLFYSCYAADSASVTSFVHNFETDAHVGSMLTLSGFSALPSAWATAIDQTFASDPNALGLNVQAGGGGSCAAHPGA